MTVKVMGPVNRLERGKVLQNGVMFHYFNTCFYTQGLLKPAILPDEKSNSACMDNEFIIMVLKSARVICVLGKLNFWMEWKKGGGDPIWKCFNLSGLV